MIEELRKELKNQIEENKELNDSITWWKNRYEAQVKINEEHQKINGELRKEIDGLVTVIDLAKNYIEEHIKYECDNAFNGMQFYSYHLYDFSKKELLEILERVNEE